MLTAADTLSLNPLIHWGLQNSDIFFIVRALKRDLSSVWLPTGTG